MNDYEYVAPTEQGGLSGFYAQLDSRKAAPAPQVAAEKVRYPRSTGFSFVGLCPTCQRVSAATVELVGLEDDTNADIVEFARDGLIVKRMPTEEVKRSAWCECASQPATVNVEDTGKAEDPTQYYSPAWLYED